jgi:hypothetical protein
LPKFANGELTCFFIFNDRNLFNDKNIDKTKKVNPTSRSRQEEYFENQATNIKYYHKITNDAKMSNFHEQLVRAFNSFEVDENSEFTDEEIYSATVKMNELIATLSDEKIKENPEFATFINKNSTAINNYKENHVSTLSDETINIRCFRAYKIMTTLD